MQRKSNRIEFNFHAPEFTQISESHCGPAVIQMLLAQCGVVVSQQQIAEAAGVTDLIEMNGTRVDQLAQAVGILAPQLQFWYKENSKFKSLIALVSEYQYPVGVEWQGLFEDEDDDEEDDDEEDNEAGEPLEDSETGDNDYGHYSLVIYVDEETKQLIIADPYKDYISQDRIFTFKEFANRWYDYNEILDPETGEARIVEDYHMMFIVAPKEETFPEQLKMKRA
jgi:hypothetical protein